MLTKIKAYFNVFFNLSIISITLFFANKYYNNKINNINNEFIKYKSEIEFKIINRNNEILLKNQIISLENEELTKKLGVLENELYQKFNNQNKINNDIKSSIANNSTRLYINTTTENGGSDNTTTENSKTSSLDDGKTRRSIINTEDAKSIISITNEGDKYRLQLISLQEWINNNIKD